MEKNSPKTGVHLMYKNLGETPNECILRFKKNNGEYIDTAMTYAGRLDPMAEGLLLVLSGEEIAQKDKYLNLPKTYTFEILWGLSTDTLDVLGVIKDENFKCPSEDELKKYLENSVGKFEQSYPAYSSKPVLGKPLFQWAREGRIGEIEIPNHEVEIFSSSFVSRKTIAGEKLLEKITFKVNSVSGDFRQKEILGKWKEKTSSFLEREFVVDEICISVSGGFYVRQFVSDIAKNFQTRSVTFSIKRTEIGEFST